MNTTALCCTTLLLSLLAASAGATDWVVDDDGGPGVDFTTVAAAVAAASHGDRIEVRAGTYSEDVTSDKPVTIHGAGHDVFLAGVYRWQDLPAGRELRIVNASVGHVLLERCDGAVLLTELDMTSPVVDQGYLSATDCHDVRVRDCAITSRLPVAVEVEASRVELVGCTVTGVRGYDGDFFSSGGPGGDGVRVSVGGFLSVAASTIRGGRGGDTSAFQSTEFGGDGGAGMLVDSSSAVLVTGGPANRIVGGDGGYGPNFGDDGIGGDGIANEGSATISGAVAVAGQSLDFIDGTALAGSGVYFQPSPAEPHLRLTGAATPGNTLTFTVLGNPGDQAVLMVGRRPSLGVWPGSGDSLLTTPLRQFALGPLNASGRAVHSVSLPSGLQPGDRFVFQARVEGGLVPRLTNSAPIVVH